MQEARECLRRVTNLSSVCAAEKDGTQMLPTRVGDFACKACSYCIPEVAEAYVGLQSDHTQLETDFREMREKAMTDELTGLGNRYAARESFDRMVASGQKIGFIQIDIVSFKAVNDKYGQSAGDALLQAISDVIRDVTRSDDELSRLTESSDEDEVSADRKDIRLGGDEFGILVNLTDAELRRDNSMDPTERLEALCDRLQTAMAVHPEVALYNAAAEEPVSMRFGQAIRYAGMSFDDLLAQSNPPKDDKSR